MGTRDNPGPFDCYHRAEPDEPMFTLLARDPQGADMVSLWAALRAKDTKTARDLFEAMWIRAINITPRRGDAQKCNEANDCADSMRVWFMNRTQP